MFDVVLPATERVRRAACLFVGLAIAGTLSVEAGARHGELPNRIPEAPPYDVEQAKAHPPPYDAHFAGAGNPVVCSRCHERIFREWNGSMMSNSWRDPAWRAAFFLLARSTATDGNCDVPFPPDGTERAKPNPFANADCSSTFDLGDRRYTTRGSGSLLDGFCSRCHMPANYIDAVRPRNVRRDAATGRLHGIVDPDFDPTSDRGTGRAFATLDGASRNTEAGKLGLTCTFCHTIDATRDTPFHGAPARSALEPVRGDGAFLEAFDVPDPRSGTLGFSVGAGAYRVSPAALVLPQRFGPLSREREPAADPYVSSAFAALIPSQSSTFQGSIHGGSYRVLFERAELCGTCHDVTNPLTVKNALGRWVGGFPIERTYSEWASSRYADRPGNANFDPAFKRDCQTCHMQQDLGKPGTAKTLFGAHGPVPPLSGRTAVTAEERPIYYSHYFVGGNAYGTRLLGADVGPNGLTSPYPELSNASFSSADPRSPYHDAYFENASARGPETHHARLAWDRLRNAVTLVLTAPKEVRAGEAAELRVTVTNTGAGHDFPTGFPEGRNAWVAVRAFDVGTGHELEIADRAWNRRSLGVGYLTDRPLQDPNFPACSWELPAGSPDPHAVQFRAVASRGDGCPTLELPYATPLNMAVDARGLPIDLHGRVIGRSNPDGLPVFRDLDGDGDRFDDAFLEDTRLRPLPNAGASVTLDRYSVVVPPDAIGPLSVTAAVYYQSMEALPAKKLLGNLADTDGDHVLEPCVLRGPCDGRIPDTEPAVVEGSPPVPVAVRTRALAVEGRSDTTPPAVSVYPAEFRGNAPWDVVPKVTASEPVTGIDASTFRLLDAHGAVVPAEVDRIDDATWALFPDRVFLAPGEAYRVRLSGVICDGSQNCVREDRSVPFSVASAETSSTGDTRPPVPTPGNRAPTARPSFELMLWAVTPGVALSVVTFVLFGLRLWRGREVS